jgi:hypothetical protein
MDYLEFLLSITCWCGYAFDFSFLTKLFHHLVSEGKGGSRLGQLSLVSATMMAYASTIAMAWYRL